MDYLKQDYPYDHEILDLILHLIVEVMCSNRKQIRIASDDKPIEIVKSSFMKLDSEHIRFVLSSFKENTTDVRNIKQYLLASIYNAPYTISAHYDAKVRHDMASGKLGGGGNQCSIHRIESEVKIFVEKSNRHCRSQPERRHRQDHNHGKFGCGTGNGGQKGFVGRHRSTGFFNSQSGKSVPGYLISHPFRHDGKDYDGKADCPRRRHSSSPGRCGLDACQY